MLPGRFVLQYIELSIAWFQLQSLDAEEAEIARLEREVVLMMSELKEDEERLKKMSAIEKVRIYLKN